MSDWDEYVSRFYAMAPEQQRAEWEELTSEQRSQFEAARPSLHSQPAPHPSAKARWKSYGARKVVWLDNPAGLFALNGPAIELVQSGSNDVPWEAVGRPVQLGRDVLGTAVTAALIQAGLQKCR